MKDNGSIWQAEAPWPRWDVTIIGAGIVGLSSAIYLKTLHPEWLVVVVERGAHPDGASIKNAGFACFGSPTEILSDLEMMGVSGVESLIRARYLGLHTLMSLVDKSEMLFQQTRSYELFGAEDESSFEQVMEALPTLNELVANATGVKSVFERQDEVITRMRLKRVLHVVTNRWEGTLHAGRMMAALVRQAYSKGVNIFWGYEMVDLQEQEDTVELHFRDRAPFHTRKILFANNGAASKWIPQLDVHPVRNQVLVTAPIKGLKLQGAFHMKEGYVYFRNIGSRVLIGGARHLDLEGSNTDCSGEIPQITQYLEQLLSEVILDGGTPQIDYRWNGFLGVGKDKSPIIRMMTDQIGVAVRLGGMGVALGSWVGKQAAEMLSNFNHS